MGNFLVVTLVALFPLVWANGCATQTDIQAEQQAREALRTQLADNKASMEDLRREIGKVRGEVDEVRYRLDRLAKERTGSGPQVKILEDRIAVLERQFKERVEAIPVHPSTAETGETAQPGPADPAAPQPGGPSSVATPQPAPSSIAKEDPRLAREPGEVQDEYRLALRAFNEQQYDRAIQLFRNFQRKYPNSEMADDAQYWVGESYFVQKDYNRAILEFNDVLKYRRGDRVPPALAKQAEAFLEIGDKTDARLILQKLINDYPNSAQAREAKEKLLTLGR